MLAAIGSILSSNLAINKKRDRSRMGYRRVGQHLRADCGDRHCPVKWFGPITESAVSLHQALCLQSVCGPQNRGSVKVWGSFMVFAVSEQRMTMCVVGLS